MRIKVKKVGEALTSNSNERATHIKVAVTHSKVNKRVYLSAMPETDLGSGVTSFMLCSDVTVTLEDMPRLNRKRLEALQAAAERQVLDKSGPAWDAVLKAMAENGLGLDDETATKEVA